MISSGLGHGQFEGLSTHTSVEGQRYAAQPTAIAINVSCKRRIRVPRSYLRQLGMPTWMENGLVEEDVAAVAAAVAAMQYVAVKTCTCVLERNRGD